MILTAMIAAGIHSPSHAAGASLDLPRAPVQYGDAEAVQRGAAVFVNYCLGCHSAQHMRYDRFTEEAHIPAELIEKHLIYNEAGIGDGMLSAMREEDGTEWFYQATPPDLTLSSRLRGPDWLYAYFRGFYRDPTRPSGWNNQIFDNLAMPHVLSDLQGVRIKNEEGELVQVSEGRLTEAEYDALVVDLVSFMAYIGEPSRAKRHKIGYLVMALLLSLLVITYFLYREYWREIH